jgi:hypothetical protein
MANQKISELTAIATIDNATDVLPIVDTSATTTKKITLTQVKTSLALNNVDNTSDANKPVSIAQQDALNAKVDENAPIVAATKTKITYDAKGLVTAGDILDAADMPTGINAANIGTGVVSSTEFGYLDGVTSAIQTQINSKQATLVSGTNIKTINSTSLLGSGDITISANPSGVSGAIQFSNGSAFASDATNLFWDDTNNRLGVGTNTPTGKTQITESFTTTGNNYSAITFDGTLTSRATASDTIFGFRNTQSIVATALSQTIIANDFTPNYTFFDTNTDSIALRIGGLKNTQNNISAILMQQTAGAGNNGLAIQPANNRWQMGFIAGQGNSLGSNPRVVFGNSGIRIGTSSGPASNLFEIQGAGSTSATTSLLVQNSAGTATLTARDDGKILIRDYISGVGENAYLRLNNSNGFEGGYNEGSGGSFQAGGSTVNLNIGGSKILQGYSGGISIGKGASNPVASAQLEVFSTSKGFLPPRMTTTEKNAIASPATGLVLYDSTTNKLQCYNGSTWNDLF